MSIDLVEMRSLLERARAEGGDKEILRALEPKGQVGSSLEQRFDALRRYRHCFCDLHAKQTERRSSLWGLVDERREHRNSPNVRIIGNTAYPLYPTVRSRTHAATTLIRAAFRERGFRRITISTSWSSAVKRFIRRSTENPASL